MKSKNYRKRILLLFQLLASAGHAFLLYPFSATLQLPDAAETCPTFSVPVHFSRAKLPVVLFALKAKGHSNEGEISDRLRNAMEKRGLQAVMQQNIFRHLVRAGLLEGGTEDESDQSSKGKIFEQKKEQSEDMVLFLARDFVDRPEVFSSLLISDFEFPPLIAHQTRALIMTLIKDQDRKIEEPKRTQHLQFSSGETVGEKSASDRNTQETSWEAACGAFPLADNEPMKAKAAEVSSSMVVDKMDQSEKSAENGTFRKKELHSGFKSSVVNEKAVKRRREKNKYEYGLPTNYETLYPTLSKELVEFNKFMTTPSTYSQEDPIRPATANVYLRHARQFLGWYIKVRGIAHEEDFSNEKASDLRPFSTLDELSIYCIFPNKEKESAATLIEFILWLRSRDVSVAYEANLLRGLIKFLKFRFARDSETDSSYGGKTFDDIPMIKEIRKLHRDASKRQRMAPRSSDENKKWLSWPEYLKVIQSTKDELVALKQEFEALVRQEEKVHRTTSSKGLRYRKGDTEKKYSLNEEDIALAYQRYLILAIFASIPDRQRTIRELEIGRTLVKEEGQWLIKHGPDDYKTGNCYGERPAMQLAAQLTPAIDEFVERWRPCLSPSTDFLFVQSRTGKPLTGDSVFQRVSRCCFKYTGKKTNPHLLRDMIVTHVRESDASEKELEALALFMGHSIHMQRTSYDRRTLTKKIAPAVKLMESINKGVDDI